MGLQMRVDFFEQPPAQAVLLQKMAEMENRGTQATPATGTGCYASRQTLSLRLKNSWTIVIRASRHG